MIDKKLINLLRVDPGEKVQLNSRDTGWAQTDALKELGKAEVKERAKEVLEESLRELAVAQQLLYADDRYSLLVIFQAMDAAGKDSTIKHVMSGVNPQGCQVFSFKQPSEEELDHTFLWRCMKRLPERGRIGIFNRSYYEEVLVVKVHHEWLDKQKLPPGQRGKSFWRQRYEDINAFEQHLVNNGTIVLKFFLHVSKDEQKERFLDRLSNSEKHWKFSLADLAERALWDEYMRAYEEMLEATSTKSAPWYVIPADDKWATRAVVADIIANALQGLDLRYPEVSQTEKQRLADARRQLESE